MLLNQNNIFGIDLGGTLTKFGLVDVLTGDITNHQSFPTPKNSMPNEVFAVLKDYIPRSVNALGFGIPCVVKNNIIKTGSKDARWIGLNFKDMAEDYFGIKCEVMNDADAAALAEIKFGVMRNLPGVTIMITLGTGIGTAIYHDNALLFNTEFGRMSMPGGIDNAEHHASVKTKFDKNLNWQEYSQRVNDYLNELVRLYWPDNIVIGGGISDDWELWSHYLNCDCNIYKASLGNTAGIIGAAIYSYEKLK